MYIKYQMKTMSNIKGLSIFIKYFQIVRTTFNSQFYTGQALVTLLFYVLTIITIITASIILLILNSGSSLKIQEGLRAYYIAESGAENALLRLLRDPNYTGENNLAVGDGVASSTVTPGNPAVIVSSGTVGNFIRKVQVTATYNTGFYTVTSWQEIQ